MIQFYAPDIQQTLTLPESDSGHCVRVLRQHEGDIIQVIDGLGTTYRCRITEAHPKRTHVEILDSVSTPEPYRAHVTLAVAPTKNMDRMEWMVEKLTEIGVQRITPILCRHSERHEIKTERLVKTAVSAMKQSLKSRLPLIDPMTPLTELLRRESQRPDTSLFIAYCDDALGRESLAQVMTPGRDAVILIGPEGDFDPAEVRAAIDAGFIPVSLGPCRLRTETAAIVACDTARILEQYNDRPNTSHTN